MSYLAPTISIDVTRADETVKAMHCSELRVVGEVFRNNSDVLLRLLALPLTLLTIGETRKDGVLFLAEALILNRQKWSADDSDEVNLEIRREAVRRHEQMAKTDPNFNAVSNAKTILAEILREDTIKRPLEALLYAARCTHGRLLSAQ